MEIHEKLKYLRQQTKKTQAEISKIISKSQSTYRGYENGKIKPKIYILKKLSEYYNVSIDYLCNHTPSRNFEDIDERQRKVFKKVVGLNNDKLQKLISYINNLLNDANKN